jgi:hypothetical protein
MGCRQGVIFLEGSFEREVRASFLKKRSKKLLLLREWRRSAPNASINKNFLLLFLKRSACFPSGVGKRRILPNYPNSLRKF